MALLRVLIALLLTAMALPARADGITGDWVGDYDCAQGNTSLTLTLHQFEGGRLDGLFHFYPRPGNPAAAAGCFTISGTFDSTSRSVTLTAGKWLLRPRGYVTVNLNGTADASLHILKGNVLGPRCGGFSLRLVSAAPSDISSCRDPNPLLLSEGN
jgi:hypothetical protein